MAWTSTVLSSSPKEVVIKATEDSGPSTGVITWAQLADLFEHPDTINAPSAPQMASITGQRQRSKTDLIVKSINSSHSHNTAKTSALSWKNSGSDETHMWGLPTDPMYKEFENGILKFEGDLHATDAVQLEVTSAAMTATKTFDLIITFGVD